MATYNGVNKALSLTPTGQKLLGSGLFGGKVRVMVDTYTTATSNTVDAGDYIEMGGELPIGAKVLEVMMHTEALGTSVLVQVGDEEDPNRYMDVDTDISAVSLNIILAAEIAGRAYEVDMSHATKVDNQLRITIVSKTTIQDAKKITLIVFYTMA